MKVAVASTGVDLDALLDERFGRCAYLIIMDSETFHFQVIDNSSAVNHGEDTGITTTEVLINNGVKVLITKNIGPIAFHELNDSNIEIYQGKSGTISEVLDDFLKGDLHKVLDPIVDTFYGLY